MNKKIITTFAIFMALSIFTGVCNKIVSANSIENENIAYKTAANTAQKAKPQTKTTKTTTPAQNNKIITTTSLHIVDNPARYLNKTVKMQATFDKFSTLGLDYQKALRSSEKYIGILIQRDDVIDHNIPLSEMKLFLTKELAEKHIDLDTGDKIEITATEFSIALGDPWLDVKDIKIIKKVKSDKEENKTN